MYVMVWKGRDSAAFRSKEELVKGLMNLTIADQPHAILYWDEEWACSVHSWKEFVN